MNLIGKLEIEEFKKSHPDSVSSLNSLVHEIENFDLQNPYKLKERYGSASIIGNGHVIFNVCGNKYRLWVIISYINKTVLVKKIGTHKEYDSWEIK